MKHTGQYCETIVMLLVVRFSIATFHQWPPMNIIVCHEIASIMMGMIIMTACIGQTLYHHGHETIPMYTIVKSNYDIYHDLCKYPMRYISMIHMSESVEPIPLCGCGYPVPLGN